MGRTKTFDTAEVVRAARGVFWTRGLDAGRPDLDPVAREYLANACTGLVIAAFTLVRVDPGQAARSLDAALRLIEPTELVPPPETC